MRVSPSPRFDALEDGALVEAIVGATHGSTTAAAAAEAELTRRFRPRVLLYGKRHLRDDAAAHDLAQEVMTRVLVKIRQGEVREPAKIGSFILGTARWTVRGQRRSEARRREVHAQATREVEAVAPDAGGGLELALDRDHLATALAQLSERERAVVVATFFEERSAAEIGARLQLAPGHVRVLRHRALAHLSARLDLGLHPETNS